MKKVNPTLAFSNLEKYIPKIKIPPERDYFPTPNNTWKKPAWSAMTYAAPHATKKRISVISLC